MTDWSPLSLDIETNMKLRDKLESSSTSLIDMRNYLFSRQCCQLLASNKAGDVAARTVSFLHNTVQEMEILEIKEMVDGSMDSWVLLACLEVVQTCERQGTDETAGLYCLWAGCLPALLPALLLAVLLLALGPLFLKS